MPRSTRSRPLGPRLKLTVTAIGICSVGADICNPPNPQPDDFVPAPPAGRVDVGVPGFPEEEDRFTFPGRLPNERCMQTTTDPSGEAFALGEERIRVLPSELDSPTQTTTEPFVLAWVICNALEFNDTTQSTYDLVIKRLSRDTTQPPLVENPDGSVEANINDLELERVPIKLPVLPADCTCLVQYVGINGPVPPEAAQVAAEQGIVGAEFPSGIEVLPLEDEPPLFFTHEFSLEGAPVTPEPNTTTIKEG